MRSGIVEKTDSWSLGLEADVVKRAFDSEKWPWKTLDDRLQIRQQFDC